MDSLFSEKVDLHSHSTASDGTYSPKELVKLAYEKKIGLFSLTDHDTVDGLPAAREKAKELGITFVPGIEVTADTAFLGPGRRELHVLGYYLDESSDAIAQLTAFFKSSRIKRNKELLARLEELGYPLTYNQMVERFGENFGKPNVARVLIEAGYFKEREEAIDFLSSLGVKREKMDYREILKLLTEGGALPVVAHPVTTKLSPHELYCFFKQAKEHGLKGVEVYHYRHKPYQVELLKDMARELRLYTTAGSDFHGENKPCIELGFLNVTLNEINFPAFCSIT
jgi:predicted metal-dependent phosphoesterase TrpH